MPADDSTNRVHIFSLRGKQQCISPNDRNMSSDQRFNPTTLSLWIAVFQTRMQRSRTVSHILSTCPRLATSILILKSCWHPQVISYTGVLQKKNFRPLTLIWRYQLIDQWSMSEKNVIGFNFFFLIIASDVRRCCAIVQRRRRWPWLPQSWF